MQVPGLTAKEEMLFVPVVDKDQKPLMPTTPSRARRWMKTGKATGFFVQGIFCVRLNVEPSRHNLQKVVIGIDPGSKREGYTIKSKAHTYLNIQATAVTWVKLAVEQRRGVRVSRRQRNTPCRKNRMNRARGGIPPSTLARWNWKLRVVKKLKRIFPITCAVVEDIAVVTKEGQRRWNTSFSPLEIGKKYFYKELGKLVQVELRKGYETANLRKGLGLEKTKDKLAEVFEAHCVDSWVLANSITGGHIAPDNKSMMFIEPIQLHRRQLHRFRCSKGGKRPRYGGTRSLGFKRGSLVHHSQFGFTYVGGHSNTTISLHDIKTGKRVTHRAKPVDCILKTVNIWRYFH